MAVGEGLAPPVKEFKPFLPGIAVKKSKSFVPGGASPSPTGLDRFLIKFFLIKLTLIPQFPPQQNQYNTVDDGHAPDDDVRERPHQR